MLPVLLTTLRYSWSCIDGLVQDCSISSASAREILQSYTKQSIYVYIARLPNVNVIHVCSIIQPESPRWLYAKNRHEAGNMLLLKISRWNGKEFCPHEVLHIVQPVGNANSRSGKVNVYFLRVANLPASYITIQEPIIPIYQYRAHSLFVAYTKYSPSVGLVIFQSSPGNFQI